MVPLCRMPDGRPHRAVYLLMGEESPGFTETRCRVTPGRSDATESATENKPPMVSFRNTGKGETVR